MINSAYKDLLRSFEQTRSQVAQPPVTQNIRMNTQEIDVNLALLELLDEALHFAMQGAVRQRNVSDFVGLTLASHVVCEVIDTLTGYAAIEEVNRHKSQWIQFKSALDDVNCDKLADIQTGRFRQKGLFTPVGHQAESSRSQYGSTSSRRSMDSDSDSGSEVEYVGGERASFYRV